MSGAADGDALERARRLGFQSGLTVQEVGYDDDVDLALRGAIEEVVGEDLVDEDFDDVVDVVVLWWREDDGDLVDALVVGPVVPRSPGFAPRHDALRDLTVLRPEPWAAGAAVQAAVIM